MDSNWGTLFIISSGVLVVVGSILALRLHAYLALILAAFVVAVLTPSTALQRYFLEDASYPVRNLDFADGTLVIEAGAGEGLAAGMRYRLIQYEGAVQSYGDRAMVEIVGFRDGLRPGEEWADAHVVGEMPENFDEADSGVVRAIHPLDQRTALKNADATIGARVATGFGNTCVKIGILIAMAGIIGKCLLDSGAADKIVRTALRWFGEPAAPVAFMSSGFLLGVPVFFDTVFYLMVPLGKAMRMRTGKNYLLYVLTIVCGATMAHSLVPPTPGPLLVAEELGVDLGTMILVGGIVGLFCALFGYIYATIINRKFELPLRESPDFSLSDLEASMQVSDDELPPFWISILPILLPVVLISGETILNHKSFPFTLGETARRLVMTLGDKNIALIISAIIAMVMLIRQKRRSLRELSTSVQAALASGGVIILITAAGGSFGSILRQTGIASLIQDLPKTSPALICTFGFLVTAAIRTAQGSASVAMITAAGILSGLARGGDLGFHPVYLAAAIGCGSKPIAWMNDSGFWVITRMSGMTEGEGLKYVTPMTSCMGLVGLVVVIIGVSIYPNW